MSAGATPLPYDAIEAAPKSGKICLVVHIQPKSGKEQELRDALKLIHGIANSSEEPGTLVYQVSESVNGPKYFIVYEEYENVAAFEKHTSGSKFKELFAKAGDIFENFHPRWYTSAF